MKYLQSKVNAKNLPSLNILLLNDLHIGAPSSNIKLLEDCLNFVSKNKHNTRILLNGDYIEGIIKDSKGDIYEQLLSPKDQKKYVKEILRPFKNYIDGATIGNHDYRIEKETSIDIVEDILEELGIPDVYLGDHGAVGFKVGDNFYSIEMHHGTGGGSTLGTIENSMKKLWKSDSDIMYCGHWHKEFVKPIKRYRIDHELGIAHVEKRWLICGNTILDTAKYAKRGGYEESFPSQALITLNGFGPKYINVSWIRL